MEGGETLHEHQLDLWIMSILTTMGGKAPVEPLDKAHTFVQSTRLRGQRAGSWEVQEAQHVKLERLEVSSGHVLCQGPHRKCNHLCSSLG